jgi:hypothetical protein
MEPLTVVHGFWIMYIALAICLGMIATSLRNEKHPQNDAGAVRTEQPHR